MNTEPQAVANDQAPPEREIRRRNRRPKPLPPPPEVVCLRPMEAAALLSISRAAFYNLLATDRTFPQGAWFSESKRDRIWLRQDLLDWVSAKSRRAKSK